MMEVVNLWKQMKGSGDGRSESEKNKVDSRYTVNHITKRSTTSSYKDNDKVGRE